MSSENTMKRKFKFSFSDNYLYIVFVFLFVVFSFVANGFANPDNLMIILRQVAIIAVVSFGMMFPITGGHIDLSVGSTMALVTIIISELIQQGFGIPIALLGGFALGFVIGLINGVLVAKVRLPAFLVTLGTMGIIRGIALATTGTMPVPLLDLTFSEVFSNASIFGVPALFMWTILAFIVAVFIYKFTPFGNKLNAVGGNPIAASYTGVNVSRVTIKTFLISSGFATMAGIMTLARMNTARPDSSADMAMDAITAVILGGTSMFGGKGFVFKTFIGALLLITITNALIILNVESNIQEIIKGVILIAAVSINTLSKKR